MKANGTVSTISVTDGHIPEGVGSAVVVNSSKTKNFLNSVSRRPVDAGGLPSVGEFYTGRSFTANIKNGSSLKFSAIVLSIKIFIK